MELCLDFHLSFQNISLINVKRAKGKTKYEKQQKTDKEKKMQEWGDKTLRDSRGVPLHIFMKMQSKFINKQDMIFLHFPNYSM